MNLPPKIQHAIMQPIRRKGRPILWTPSRIGLGNFFYLWLQAFVRQRQGFSETRALLTDDMRPWMTAFPEVASDLVITPREVRLSDRRDLGYFQRMGLDHTMEDVIAFCEKYLLSSPELRDELDQASTSIHDNTIVVNVRRGDYYSVPEFRGLYSFDIVSYVQEALNAAREKGPVPQVHVVSDGIPWCRLKLAPIFGSAQVSYSSVQPRRLEHLGNLGVASRLILGNSTFSYWGAHLAVAGGRADPRQVWAPRFHRRDAHGNGAYQLDPRWSVIETIPGGWDA